jgi:hypothetical protein
LTLQLPQNQWLMILQYVSISLMLSYIFKGSPPLLHWCT